MDGIYELLVDLEGCERRLAETRRRFVFGEGRTESANNVSLSSRSVHAELVKLEAELRHLADRLHEFRLAHHHQPAGHAGHA